MSERIAPSYAQIMALDNQFREAIAPLLRMKMDIHASRVPTYYIVKESLVVETRWNDETLALFKVCDDAIEEMRNIFRKKLEAL